MGWVARLWPWKAAPRAAGEAHLPAPTPATCGAARLGRPELPAVENLPEEVRTPHGRDSAADTHMPFPLHFPVAGGGDKLRHPPTRSYSGHPPRIPNPGVGAGPWKSSPPPATNPPRITLRGRRGGGCGREGRGAVMETWRETPVSTPPGSGPALPHPPCTRRGLAGAGSSRGTVNAGGGGSGFTPPPPPHHPPWFLVGKPCA